uniref:Uncharacterized protein n=1 Tax=Rhizophora mucronata TaxID=61149 RepID=A0A2P2QK26_RHIMU
MLISCIFLLTNVDKEDRYPIMRFW